MNEYKFQASKKQNATAVLRKQQSEILELEIITKQNELKGEAGSRVVGTNSRIHCFTRGELKMLKNLSGKTDRFVLVVLENILEISGNISSLKQPLVAVKSERFLP